KTTTHGKVPFGRGSELSGNTKEHQREASRKGKGDSVHYSSTSSVAKSEPGSGAALRGRPRGRRLASIPKRLAASCTQAACPKGRPRWMHSRRLSTSASVCGWLTYSNQPAGRATGPASNGGPPGRSGAALDHSQAAALSAKPARTGLRST